MTDLDLIYLYMVAYLERFRGSMLARAELSELLERAHEEVLAKQFDEGF